MEIEKEKESNHQGPTKKQRGEEAFYVPPPGIQASAYINSLEQYQKMYERSVSEPEAFWGELAAEMLTWYRPFHHVQTGSFEHGDIAWFLGGQLNACYQCVDRHVFQNPDKVAILWEGDEPSMVKKVTYGELLREVSKMANVLKSVGVKKGDVVAIYMPMVPEAIVAMLACARIGAPHSVVFAGFSAEALRQRILDAKSTVLITADQGKRGGRIIPLKETVDEALLGCPDVKTVFVHKRTGANVPFHPPRDIDLKEAMDAQRPYCPCEAMDSDDPLFLLYTSGSTGKPKGLMHTIAGYLLYTSVTHRFVFDCHPDSDIYACVADVGWITGHSYIVYGPLCNGATTLMFESTPLYPDAGRYWDVVERHKVTIFYTAPTAIRAIMKAGNDIVKKYDRSSLRILGSVGEPINPTAWKWYYEIVGEGKCSIVDTYWQTETGGILITSLPGAVPSKPGSAGLPFFGVQPALLDGQSGQPITETEAEGLLALSHPWPGISRTVLGDHQRYLRTYMHAYKGYYFTGDGARRDSDGFYWITGRVDDVINVSGHRLGTAEIENSLVAHVSCNEAAVIAIPHDIKGSAIFCYCVLKERYEGTENLAAELKMEVRRHIGPFATPDHIVFVTGLPKTRSGKIMRRLLRKIASGESSPEDLGDTSTLADESVVQHLIDTVNEHRAHMRH
ncbi:acetyl-coenzyme A synthetase 2 [Balamuthia mandrillaris]